ncbi:cytochrome P450 monooxygenase-like protein [Macrophomina phaseolina]|uniref:Cytochrome P450 monooxygenase-like protein n=1 Tax=Macrophomina phaseolina TaxID=35725 RepID=A0ABQ8G4D7_9PEZI|nr:cytochrome P450 monooxygenase-like protein [Macrophomina phaseolina]
MGPYSITVYTALSCLLGYLLCRLTYNLFLHPLARLPGPWTAALGDLWFASHWLSGTWHRDIEALHRKYGPVVRVAPNELSFCGVQSIKDIYGTRQYTAPTFFKKCRTFYLQSDVKYPSIGTEVDPVKHHELRKMISPGFSPPTLKSQGYIIAGYVNTLVQQIQERSGQPLEMNRWFLWFTFDVITDLVFGESLKNVERGEPDQWLTMLQGSGPVLAVAYILRRQPKAVIAILRRLLANKKSAEMRAYHVRMSQEMAKRRIAKGAMDREDIFNHLVGEGSKPLDPEVLALQGPTLIGAGSETTSLTLMMTTYHLLRNPDKLAVLQDEVRSAFSNRGQIDSESTKSLRYLNAVIEEALRLTSPASFGLPRISPGAVVDGIWVPQGTRVFVAENVTARDPRYFLHPEEFHPERWLPRDHPLYDSRFENDVKEASKPFLVGPRACLGMHLAYLEMRLCISNLVWQFNWTLGEEGAEFENNTKLLGLWRPATLPVTYEPVKRE